MLIEFEDAFSGQLILVPLTSGFGTPPLAVRTACRDTWRTESPEQYLFAFGRQGPMPPEGAHPERGGRFPPFPAKPRSAALRGSYFPSRCSALPLRAAVRPFGTRATYCASSVPDLATVSRPLPSKGPHGPHTLPGCRHPPCLEAANRRREATPPPWNFFYRRSCSLRPAHATSARSFPTPWGQAPQASPCVPFPYGRTTDSVPLSHDRPST